MRWKLILIQQNMKSLVLKLKMLKLLKTLEDMLWHRKLNIMKYQLYMMYWSLMKCPKLLKRMQLKKN
ncbi:unnamed protein product [Diamesa hyperborea]